MKSGTSFRLIVLILLAPPMAVAQQKSQPSIPNSPDGFDKQYKNLFKAFEKAEKPSKPYKEENKAYLTERFRTFVVPEGWFTDVFGPEEGSKLAKHYSELFRAFQVSTTVEFSMVLGEWSAQVHTKALRAYQINPLDSAQTSVPPILTVQVFRVQHFTAPLANPDGTFNGRFYDHHWVESFIYVDGAFRFIGTYNCAFWRPCSANDPVFRGQLIRRDPAQ
jgi:hypothetical protein